MKKNYNKEMHLRCVVCGSDQHFEYNDDKSYVKCNLCNREYLGGYDELKEMNEALIADGIEELKKEVGADIKQEISDMFRNAFKGCKNITIK